MFVERDFSHVDEAFAALPGKGNGVGLFSQASLKQAAVVLSPSRAVVVEGQLVLVPTADCGGKLHVALDAGMRATGEGGGEPK